MCETHPIEAAHDGHAKVSDLEGAGGVAEDVVRLDVHDYDAMAVQEVQALHTQAASHICNAAALENSGAHHCFHLCRSSASLSKGAHLRDLP